MKIALDYDGTFTLDPEFWSGFIGLAKLIGADVRIVTHRHEELDKITLDHEVPIIYTDGVAKKWYCEHRGDYWTPDIWIDDKPKGIYENGPLSQEEVIEWRKTRA